MTTMTARTNPTGRRTARVIPAIDASLIAALAVSDIPNTTPPTLN